MFTLHMMHKLLRRLGGGNPGTDGTDPILAESGSQKMGNVLSVPGFSSVEAGNSVATLVEGW